MQKYNVVFATDKNYLHYLETALKSLLAHHSHLSVFILHTGDISVDWSKKLTPYFNKRSCALKLAYLSPENLSNFEGKDYITTATYLRYYLEDLFPHSESPYWIYLDCDLIINGNITAPFHQDNFNSGSIGAVYDRYVHSLKNHPYIYNHYFNAGVLYLNSNIYAQKMHKQQLLTLTKQLKDKLIFGDQDVLNYYFQNNWVQLDKKYNYQSAYIVTDNLTDENDIPHIVHFTGSLKPLECGKFADNKLEQWAKLFRFYYQLSWEQIVELPLGTIQLKPFLDNIK